MPYQSVVINNYGDIKQEYVQVHDLKREKIMNDLKLSTKTCQALNGCTRTATTTYKNSQGRTMHLCETCNAKRLEAIKKAKRK